MSKVHWALAVVLAFGCDSKGIDSESHFLCTADSDCSALDGGTCVEGKCQVSASNAGGTSGASSGGNGGKQGAGGLDGGAVAPDAETNSGGAASLDGATSKGGTGDASITVDGATNKGGAPSVDGSTSAGGAAGLGGAMGKGGTADASTTVDGSTNAGGTANLDAATNTGGAGGASIGSGGTLSDAGIDASTDAALPAPCSVTSTTLLAYTTVGVDQIVLDGGYLYYHDQVGIWRVPRSGGTPALVASTKPSVWPADHAFVVDDWGVTWWQDGPSGDGGSRVTRVNRTAKTGGAVTTLATLPPAEGSSNLDYPYGVSGPAGSVFLWPANGGLNPVLLQVSAAGSLSSWGKLPYYARDVVFDGTDVFATGDNGIYVHISTPTFDGFTSIASGGFAKEMVLDDTTIYIGSSDANGNIWVYSVPKTGGTAGLLMNGASSGIYLGNLVLDASDLYVVERKAPAIVRMSTDGSNQTAIVTGLATEEILSVAVDDTCIYWSVEGGTQTRSGVYAAPK